MIIMPVFPLYMIDIPVDRPTVLFKQMNFKKVRLKP